MRPAPQGSSVIAYDTTHHRELAFWLGERGYRS